MADSERPSRRYAVLTQGFLADPITGKTAQGVIRFRPEDIAAVIDSDHAGKRVSQAVPSLKCDAAVVATLEEALKCNPTSLLIGVATVGGHLPPAMRSIVLEAIDAGLEIVNGMHQMLSEDPEIVARAARSGARLWDVRAVPPLPIFRGDAYDVPQQIVLAVGSDCAVGKMTAVLEIERAAIEAGTRAAFVPRVRRAS